MAYGHQIKEKTMRGTKNHRNFTWDLMVSIQQIAENNKLYGIRYILKVVGIPLSLEIMESAPEYLLICGAEAPFVAEVWSVVGTLVVAVIGWVLYCLRLFLS
jgi:hypothetical protein